MSKIESKVVDTKIEQEESRPMVISTEIDAYVHERLKSQPRTLEEIQVKSPDVDQAKHFLALPESLEKMKDKYAFRWINKDKRMIDRAIDIRGWNIVNRMLFPSLPKHLFTANGTVERGDAILGFMPLKKAQELRRQPGIRSNERVKNLPIEKWKQGGEKYYKPALTEEKDGVEVKNGIQPDALDNAE